MLKSHLKMLSTLLKTLTSEIIIQLTPIEKVKIYRNYNSTMQSWNLCNRTKNYV